MSSLISCDYAQGYALYLDDHNSWWLTGCVDCFEFVSELAFIMRLNETSSDSLPKIIFCKTDYLTLNKSLNQNLDIHSLQENGWVSYDYGKICFWHHNDFPDIICEIRDYKNRYQKYTAMWMSLQSIYLHIMKTGGLPFHAALIQSNNHGVLLAAEGEVGKSTCCRRLPSHWQALCDDESLIVLNKSKEYRVHPFPTWSDYIIKRAENTWDVQRSIPLSAIFFIEQSETDEAISLSVNQASIRITDSSVQAIKGNQTFEDNINHNLVMATIFNNSLDIAKLIPAFRLKVSLKGEFWKEIERVIS